MIQGPDFEGAAGRDTRSLAADALIATTRSLNFCSTALRTIRRRSADAPNGTGRTWPPGGPGRARRRARRVAREEPGRCPARRTRTRRRWGGEDGDLAPPEPKTGGGLAGEGGQDKKDKGLCIHLRDAEPFRNQCPPAACHRRPGTATPEWVVLKARLIGNAVHHLPSGHVDQGTYLGGNNDSKRSP